jgi:hypothetical protein
VACLGFGVAPVWGVVAVQGGGLRALLSPEIAGEPSAPSCGAGAAARAGEAGREEEEERWVGWGATADRGRGSACAVRCSCWIESETKEGAGSEHRLAWWSFSSIDSRSESICERILSLWVGGGSWGV